MILDLREFEDFPANARLEAERGEIDVGREDVLAVNTVSLDLSIQKSGEEYYCQGRMTGQVEMECARCLEEYAGSVSGNMDFIISSEATAQARKQEAIDDEDYVFFEGDDIRVDVTSIVRQALALALPMKPLCQEDCRGLCSSCGVNLNETSCDCRQEKTDPRWEGLSGLASE